MERDTPVDEFSGASRLEHHVGDGDAACSTLRVLVYNARHCRGAFSPFISEKRTSRVIRALSPDVAGLTEIYCTRRRNQPSRLSELTGLTQLFHGVRPVTGGEYGNLLLSRFGLQLVAKVRLQGGWEDRGCLIVTADLPQGELTVALTHLGLGAASRRKQIAELARILPVDRPLILMGDFNGPTRELSPLSDLVRDLPDSPRTFPAVLPFRALDRVLCSAHFEFSRVEALRSLASDHRPLVVELRWVAR